MALVGTPQHRGTTLQLVGVAGVNDDDVVMELNDVFRFNTFSLFSRLGAMDVDISLDGVNFTTAPISLEDEHSTNPQTRVVVTTAARWFRIFGDFKAIRIQQNGATAVADPILICGQVGRTR